MSKPDPDPQPQEPQPAPTGQPFGSPPVPPAIITPDPQPGIQRGDVAPLEPEGQGKETKG